MGNVIKFDLTQTKEVFGFSDLFMKRVEEDGMWSLFDPKVMPKLPDLYGKEFEKVYIEGEQKQLFEKQIKARDLYARIMKSMAETGHPWMTYKDASNIKSNQTANPENVIHLSNLCTEILEVTNKKETAVCNLGSINLGKGNWKVDMHPTRDRPVFEKITAELGLNPDEMPVSKKAWYGWGGAMGPGQFIPSTWVLYKDRVGKLTGENPPNPWTARTAVYATSLLMSDNGADDGTRAAERLAALRYLAGWKNATKAAYAFYGDDVMEFADKYQKEIDILER
jgi:hypothetical protein